MEEVVMMKFDVYFVDEDGAYIVSSTIAEDEYHAEEKIRRLNSVREISNIVCHGEV